MPYNSPGTQTGVPQPVHIVLVIVDSHLWINIIYLVQLHAQVIRISRIDQREPAWFYK